MQATRLGGQNELGREEEGRGVGRHLHSAAAGEGLVGGVRPLVEAAAGKGTRGRVRARKQDLGGGRGTERGVEEGTAGICVFLLHPTVAAVEDEAARAAEEGRRRRTGGGRLRRRHPTAADDGPAGLGLSFTLHSLADFVAFLV